MTFPIAIRSPAAQAPGGAPPGGGLRAAQPPAGLVSSKTSGPSDRLEVSFDPELVMARRVAHLRRHVWACGQLHALHGSTGSTRQNVWFVTLTYRGVNEWQPRHISDCTKAVRKWCKRRGVPFRYVWVAELQMRGALHYHMAVWLPRSIRLPKFDKQQWWPHGMTQTVLARNPVGYLMKYLSKINARQRFPKGVRIYGSGGLTEQGQHICAWLRQPSWCKQRFGVGELRTLKGRRVVRATGEILAPMYTRICRPAGMYLYPNAPLPIRWADGPYSTVNAAERVQ
jgi:hypothetical protein